MIRLVTCFAAMLMALIPVRVSTQEMLTLERAIDETLARNASLRAARAASAEDTARITEARSGWFPRISVGESWQRGDQPVYVFSSLLAARQFASPNFAIDALNHPDPIGFFRTSIGVEQRLFDGGRQRSAANSATLRREMSALVVDETAASLALAATQAFGRVLAAGVNGRAISAALEAAREDLARAGRRRDAGMATDADVLALAVHAADLQHRLIQSQGAAAIARAELNRLMGASVDRDYDIGTPEAPDTTTDLNMPLDALLAEADRARPELRRAVASEELADAGRRNARSALVPQVAAQAAFDVSGTRFADRASSWVVGGDVRWSLSLGGAERAQMKAATEARGRARAEAEEARAAVHVEVITALRRLEAARAQQDVGRAAVEQAQESERIIRNRFDAGVAGVTDLLRASSAGLDAEARRTDALVDAIVSRAMLRRALGRRP